MSSSFRTTALFITIVTILATTVKGVACTINVPGDETKTNDAGFCYKSFLSLITVQGCTGETVITCVPAVIPGTAYNYPVGITTVTCHATDDNGDTPSDMYTITVNDIEPPDAICHDHINVELNANGNGQITANDIDNDSSDNCGIASRVIDISSFTCADVGNNTITLNVTDVHGNDWPCDSTVIVEDSIDPVAICQDITAQLDDTGNVQITLNDIDNGSNDACGIASRVISKSSFICDNVGHNTITLTVTDVNGNTNTCQSIVTVAWNVNCPTEAPTNDPTNDPTQAPTKDQSDSKSNSQSDEMSFNMNVLFEQREKDYLHVNFESTQDTASDNTKLSVLGLFLCIVMAIHLCYLCQKGFNKQQKVDSDSLQGIKISE